MRGVVWWCPNIVLGSPWPNGNAMAGPVRNFSSGAVQIQSRFPFLKAGVKKCNKHWANHKLSQCRFNRVSLS